MIKYCNTCGLADPMQRKCRRTGKTIDLDSDFCSKHDYNPTVCAICNRITMAPVHTQNKDEWVSLCQECAGNLTSCAFCKNKECRFETDPSPMPRLVQKQVRQGNMISVVTVKNPDLVATTCKMGCPCYDPENECMRQFNYCERIKHIYD